jgi:hypothetical protein
MYQVVKRDGKVTDFNLSKISAAITKAFEAQQKPFNPDIVDLLALKVTADYTDKIKDGNDFFNPTLKNEGLSFVIVDGKVVVEDGVYNGTRAARLVLEKR